MEAEAIRKYSSAPITTNCMGGFVRYDHYKMAKHLDFYSDDVYPSWYTNQNKQETVAKAARNASLCRNMKDGKPFISFPSRKGKDDKYWNHVYCPLAAEDVEEIAKQVEERMA
jgi:beta-galactosidase GanA